MGKGLLRMRCCEVAGACLGGDPLLELRVLGFVASLYLERKDVRAGESRGFFEEEEGVGALGG